MVTWHGKIFNIIDTFTKNLRRFNYTNGNLFEALFVFIYLVEQILLIIFVFILKDNLGIGLVVPLYVAIVLSTFSLYQLRWRSKYKYLEKEMSITKRYAANMEQKCRSIVEQYNIVADLVQNRKQKSINSKKRQD